MEFKHTASAEIIAKELNLISQMHNVFNSNYYSLNNDDNIITNVPSSLYKKELIKYAHPQFIDNKYIELLKLNINLLHNNKNTESFRLNECFKNSEIIYEFLQQSNNNINSNIKSPVKIVYGYFSRKIPLKTLIGDKMTTKEFILHDWHVWNYIDNFIIDVSIFKIGTFLNINTQFSATWKDANNHIFAVTPKSIDYFGIEFDSREKFIIDFRKTFNV